MNYWAHRGLSYLYPENTLEAFERAFQYDICGIELDVQLSKDEQLVVIHDETLDRTTDLQGYVKDYTLAELKEAKITFKDKIYRIPTLAEVFSLCRDHLAESETYINIELKNSVFPYPGMEKKVLEMVKAFELQDHIVYSSFNHDSLKLMKQLDPKAHLAVLADDVRDCFETARQLNTRDIHPYIGSLGHIDLSGYVVRAWNLSDKEPLNPSENVPYHYSYEELHELGVTDYITNNVQLYMPLNQTEVPARKQKAMPGKAIDPETGKTVASEEHSVFFEPVYLRRGTILKPKEAVAYRPYFYQNQIRPELLHSFAYDEEANYSSYVPAYFPDRWQTREFAMKEDGYLRMELQGQTDHSFEEIFEIMDMPCSRKRNPRFRDEEERIIRRLKQFRKKGDLLFILGSDLHGGYGSSSEETLRNIKHLCRRIYPDAVIDLGDQTDGSLNKEQTTELVERIRKDSSRFGVPVYRCLGDHDFNDFQNNNDFFTRTEAEELYLDGQKEDRYVDYKDVRLIFLSSYDPEQENRCGFSMRSLRKLRYLLFRTPKDKKIILFSHLPPMNGLCYSGETLRNSNRLIRILENHQKKNRQIKAYLHGHVHAENAYTKLSFPILGIGCMKPEDYQNRKPEGSITYARQIGTATQELFDLMLVGKDGIRFIRYGAGEDRMIKY